MKKQVSKHIQKIMDLQNILKDRKYKKYEVEFNHLLKIVYIKSKIPVKTFIALREEIKDVDNVYRVNVEERN